MIVLTRSIATTITSSNVVVTWALNQDTFLYLTYLYARHAATCLVDRRTEVQNPKLNMASLHATERHTFVETVFVA